AVGFGRGRGALALCLASGFFGRKIPAPPIRSPPVSCARAVVPQTESQSATAQITISPTVFLLSENMKRSVVSQELIILLCTIESVRTTLRADFGKPVSEKQAPTELHRLATLS